MWGVDGGWRFSPSPIVAIGGADAPPEYQVGWVGGAIRFGNGHIVVGNGSELDLRFYGERGAFLQRAGGKGGGPGEFNTFADLRIWRLPNGLIVVGDQPVPRLNIFDSTGSFLETLPLERPAGVQQVTLVGTFHDGTYLVMSVEAEPEASAGAVISSTIRYLHYASDATASGLLFQVPSAPRYVHASDGVVRTPYLPLTVDPVVVADSASIVLLRSGAPELERYDLKGRLIQRIVLGRSRLRVTRDLFSDIAARDLSQINDPLERRLTADYYRRPLTLPEFVPSYRDLVVDQNRNLWLEWYRLPGDTSRSWDVVSPSGTWLGTIRGPDRFWLHSAGIDYVLGTRMDHLGIEYVEVYQLDKVRLNPSQ